MEFKKYVLIMNSIFIILGLIAIALGIVAKHNIYFSATFLAVGVIQIVVAGFAVFRSEKRVELFEKGNVNIQHAWWIISLGIAALVIAASPLAKVGALTYVSITISTLWIVLSILHIVLTWRETGASLVV